MVDDSWQDRGACRDYDVELFYSLEELDVQTAVSICAECPVRLECLNHAMTTREHFGVWGGTTETERRRIFRRERRRRTAERRKTAAA